MGLKMKVATAKGKTELMKDYDGDEVGPGTRHLHRTRSTKSRKRILLRNLLKMFIL